MHNIHPKMTTVEMLDTPHLKTLVDAGAVSYVSARGVPGGFVLTVRVGLKEKSIRAVKQKNVRIFSTLPGVANYLAAAGIRRFDIDLTGYSKEALF
jgi:hypothetical protein